MSTPSNDEQALTPNSTKETATDVENQNSAPAPAGETAQVPVATSSEPSKLKKLWNKLDLDTTTVLIMMKGGLAPTICLAFFQATPVANEYTTLGYLIAISSLLSLPILHRAKFIENMILNILSVCLGAAISILATWSALQARLHTQGSRPAAYNSSASVVCAIWLIFQVYLINYFRSARPQFVFPGILTSIFAVVSMTNGALFPTTAYCLDFAKRLLTTFLTGFAIATGVSLFVLPTSSRKVVFKELTGFISGLQGLIKIELAYMQALEKVDMFRDTIPEVAASQATAANLKALQAKLMLDMPYAKREVAYGKLIAHDIGQIYRYTRATFLPILGLTQITDVLKRIAELSGWLEDGHDEPSEHEIEVVKEWQEMMSAAHEPFQEIMTAMVQALEHAMLVLEMKKNKQTDVEAQQPGSPTFAKYYESKVQEFIKKRASLLHEWCSRKGMTTALTKLETPVFMHGATKSQRLQRQLLVLLYLEWLIQEASQSILDFVKYADETATRKNHLVLPGFKRVKKWIGNIFSHQGPNELEETEQDHAYYLGEALRVHKDPEHLPPATSWQKATDVVRKIPAFFRSEHSAFGFRVVCAVMSVCVVAFLRNTYEFFLAQRLFWAAIMVAISMNRLAGQSTFSFILRVFGTTIACVASFVVYYIADGKTAGVLVFEYIWICLSFYIVVKHPRYTPVGMISAVTTVLIIGYTFQVRKIGVVLATSNRQDYYPIYELAPFRLATVAGGLLVAYIWTLFPYPISEHSEIRRDLGAAVYLLAHHYSIVHETVTARVRGDDIGDPMVKTSPGRRLEKARMESFTKQSALIARLRVMSAFHPWSLTLGGKFPKELYDACIKHVDTILNYSALIAYASKTYTVEDDNIRPWQTDLYQLQRNIETTSNSVTTRLILLSHSISTGNPLPPHLGPMEPFELLKGLESIDRNILNIDHSTEPGYAAFAVMQIASRTVITDLNKLTECVRELVGELDFAFYHSQNSSKSGDSDEHLDEGGKAKERKHD